MEATSRGPEYLGALFKLDHLATRMRRNAESLLVMSGAEQPRQWHESIAMLDVVRAATAEIADFARVGYSASRARSRSPGNAVADVAHLLAELLENATVFSPPGHPGRRHRHAGRAALRDLDHRRGHRHGRRPPRRGERAAEAAAGVGLALSRTLGLHVVGNLATRYGITVQLRRSATGGITAVVALPAKVLARLARPEDMADAHDRYAPKGRSWPSRSTTTVRPSPRRSSTVRSRP